jgi:hypothetical protein
MTTASVPLIKTSRPSLVSSLKPSLSKSIPRLSKGLPAFEYGYDSTDNHSNSASSAFLSQPCKSNWDVHDSKLSAIPPLHPPIPPNCMTYIGDTSSTPSIIASRISECLRKRSIVVEYVSDGATPNATCLNQDGVLFEVCLYQGGKGTITGQRRGKYVDDSMNSTLDVTFGSASSPTNRSAMADFSHGVIVECMRIRGDTISFHRDCRAILSSARGDSDGLDDLRSPNVKLLHSLPGFGCKRSRALKPFGPLKASEILQFEQDNMPTLIDVRKLNTLTGVYKNALAGSQATFKSLESALDKLEKDRLDATLLGLESLALLTDAESSGLERAYLTSLSVLGPSNKKWDNVASGPDQKEIRALSRTLHERIKALVTGNFKQTTAECHLIAANDSDVEDSDNHNEDCDIVTEYRVRIRRCAMLVLTNSLEIIVQHSDDFPLLPKPSCDDFISIDMLERIGDDLAGANRPPLASLGSAHEATYAAKFLRLISTYSEKGHNFVNNSNVGNPPRSVIGLLDRARIAGSSSHRALELEAQLAHLTLGENGIEF